MEELEKLKKQTKTFKKISISLLIIDIILFIVLFISIKTAPQSPAPPMPSESMKRELFNAKLTGYIGYQKGSVVKALIYYVMQNNELDKEHQIELTGITKTSEISNSSTYTMEPSYSDEGYINKINIIEETEDN